MKGEYITIKEAREGMPITNRSYGDGVIKQVLKTRVKVKFDRREDLVTYDSAHIKICLIER